MLDNKVVTDKSQVDQLNLAANMVGPIALAARLRDAVVNQATINTSRAVSVAVLPTLQF
jgi:hypothetical protein